jgi:F0F1-type ATP synthase membrane subunit c/vacuolar-type H+-ATPase subunit K
MRTLLPRALGIGILWVVVAAIAAAVSRSEGETWRKSITVGICEATAIFAVVSLFILGMSLILGDVPWRQDGGLGMKSYYNIVKSTPLGNRETTLSGESLTSLQYDPKRAVQTESRFWFDDGRDDCAGGLLGAARHANSPTLVVGATPLGNRETDLLFDMWGYHMLEKACR